MSGGYYQSHEKLDFIGKEGQKKISAANVLVIGAGGLGCPCLLALTGCGVGNIGIADFDTVSISNLHRQILFTVDDTGKKKSVTSAERLKHHNPDVRFQVHDLRIDQENILQLISEYDIIIDATDNFMVRYIINDACVYAGKPLVYGAIYKTEGHVTVFNMNGSPTLRCLFPDTSGENYIPSCAEVGAYGITTGIVGQMMANEAIKIILGSPQIISGKLLCYNCLDGKTNTIGYKENPQSRSASIKRFMTSEISVEVSPELFRQETEKAPFRLIDVREIHERMQLNAGGEHIPLNTLNESAVSHILPSEKIFIYCQSGARSYQAAKRLRSLGLPLSFSIIGGVRALL